MSRDTVVLSRFQALKVWERAFATSWSEVGPDHPARSAMEKLARAGFAPPEVLEFIETGRIDVTVGMPSGRRYQQVAEDTEQGMTPNFESQNAMIAYAAQTGQPTSGSF